MIRALSARYHLNSHKAHSILVTGDAVMDYSGSPIMLVSYLHRIGLPLPTLRGSLKGLLGYSS